METASAATAIEDILDVQQLHESLTAVGPDPLESLALLRETYLEDAENLIAQLEAAILRGLAEPTAPPDFNPIRFASHTLKSSSALMGATRLSQLCGQIELQARQQNFDGLSELVAQASSAQQQIAAVLLNYDPSRVGKNAV